MDRIIGVAPTLVLANAGSPMMWFGILHVLILNLIIGIAESRIISYYGGISNRTWLIVLANYISMFIGMQLIAPYFSSMYGNNDFWGGQTSLGEYELDGFMMGMLCSFIATLIIEFPFTFLSVRSKVERKNLLKPYIIANLATNTTMFILYFLIAIRGSE